MNTPNGYTYPYILKGKAYYYAPTENPWMQMARMHAQAHSLDKTMPGAAVIVKNDILIGSGANGSTYHDTHGCERAKQGIPSGEGYELCEGCHPKNHSEPTAIANALAQGNDPAGADLYLWGHWWCCSACWSEMEKAGITHVYLLENSDVLFNKNAPNNIVGRQFDA